MPTTVEPTAVAGAAENVKVIVRVRPMNDRERKLQCKSIIAVDASERSIELQNPKDAADSKAFPFYTVYGMFIATDRIYNECVAPLVESALEGYNATIFAYGQTGSGKSFSMQGAVGQQQQHSSAVVEPSAPRAIIPRALEHVFDAVQTASEAKFLVHCSYIEIYMEEVRDLLSKTDYKKPLELRESPNTGVYVQGLTWNAVKTVEECNKIMERGWKNRSVGETLMNRDSSRSHSVFSISIERMTVNESDGSEHIVAGKLNLVDLAGSERQSKTGATGERLKEATKINLSLSALANVISALTDPKVKHVPFRDSKLTRLLQDSLGGNTKTLMLACISPADNNYEETLSTLRYAARAQRIKNKPTVNEDPKDALLRQYQEEIMRLKIMLEQHVKSAPWHDATTPSVAGGRSSSKARGGGASVVSGATVDIDVERHRVEADGQRALDDETQRLQREFEQQMSALQHDVTEQQAELEQMTESEQQLPRGQNLQREKLAQQTKIEALRRQYEARITDTTAKQTNAIESATIGRDVVIVDAGDDQPLIGFSTLPSDENLSEQQQRDLAAAEEVEANFAVTKTFQDKAVQVGGAQADDAVDVSGKQTSVEKRDETSARSKSPQPTAAGQQPLTSTVETGGNKRNEQEQTSKPSASAAAVSQPKPITAPVDETVSSEDLLKRIAELQKQVVGGEKKDDASAVKRRAKQRETVDEHRKKFAQIVSSVGEREHEEQAMFEVYENIQSDLMAQERQLKLAKRKINSLSHELQDTRDEFAEERGNILEMTREAERQRQLCEQILLKMASVVRRDCNYGNVEAVKTLALWDDHAQQWILPSIKFEQLNLSEAPSLPGFIRQPHQQSVANNAAASIGGDASVFDDRRLFKRLATVKTPGLRIKRQDHLRGERRSSADGSSVQSIPGGRKELTSEEVEGLLVFPKIPASASANISAASSNTTPQLPPPPPLLLSNSNALKPNTAKRSSRTNSGKSQDSSSSSGNNNRTALPNLINLPRPKL